MQTTTRRSRRRWTQQNNAKAEQQLFNVKSTRRNSKFKSCDPSNVIRGVATRRSRLGFFRKLWPSASRFKFIQSRLIKLKLTEGGADFPLVFNVNCILSVNFIFYRLPQCEQRHFGISTHYHQSRCEHRQSDGATFITASATFMVRTTTIWSCNYTGNSIYSKCEHRHSELPITVICAFNAQYDPNINVWGPKKVIYSYFTRDT